MADTYTAIMQQQQLGASKSMFALWNASGSSKIIRVSRIGVMSSRINTVTGVMIQLGLYSITACSSGTSMTFVKHNSSTADMPGATGIICSTGATVTNSTMIRKIAWSSDEPTGSSSSIDEWQTMVAPTIIWDAGYGDTTLQLLTLREEEGISLRCETSSTAGYLDAWIEMTIGSS